MTTRTTYIKKKNYKGKKKREKRQEGRGSYLYGRTPYVNTQNPCLQSKIVVPIQNRRLIQINIARAKEVTFRGDLR